MRSEPATGGDLRCAIYTRKSTEEGLEQAFNSLDAQREACAAYILSQRHEGWQPSPEIYDDGGFSGGSMDRPALRRLLMDASLRDGPDDSSSERAIASRILASGTPSEQRAAMLQWIERITVEEDRVRLQLSAAGFAWEDGCPTIEA